MNLNCPYCGETIPYDASLAGRPAQCSYCENTIKMPLVEELPPELREELRREQVKRHEQQKRSYRRKQERFLKEMDKEEQQKRREEARQQQQQLHEKVKAARKPVPEELAVGKRYRALRALAKWNKLLAGLILLGCLAYVLMDVIAALRGAMPWSWLLIKSLLLAVPTAFVVLLIWAGGEMIQAFLDIADDVRITRLLMKKRAYRDEDSASR
jgi:uncharacterized membrane protein YdbT with pleckstrin-like domain